MEGDKKLVDKEHPVKAEVSPKESVKSDNVRNKADVLPEIKGMSEDVLYVLCTHLIL